MKRENFVVEIKSVNVLQQTAFMKHAMDIQKQKYQTNILDFKMM